MSLRSAFQNLPGVQAIVEKYAEAMKCKKDDTCRCESCKSITARHPSRKKAREGSSFTRFVFPMVRRVYDPLAVPLVGIQPMTQPAGSIFYLDYTKASQEKDDEEGEK